MTLFIKPVSSCSQLRASDRWRWTVYKDQRCRPRAGEREAGKSVPRICELSPYLAQSEKPRSRVRKSYWPVAVVCLAFFFVLLELLKDSAKQLMRVEMKEAGWRVRLWKKISLAQYLTKYIGILQLSGDASFWETYCFADSVHPRIRHLKTLLETPA